MIWEKKLSDGSVLYIKNVFSKGFGRTEREYAVSIVTSTNVRRVVCLVGETGKPTKWYVSLAPVYDVELVKEALKELPPVLAMEQVHSA